MSNAGSAVFVIGPYYGGDFSTGIDNAYDAERLSDGYSGGILTNEIGTIKDWVTTETSGV